MKLLTATGALSGRSFRSIAPHDVRIFTEYVAVGSIVSGGALEYWGLGDVASFGAEAPHATVRGAGFGSPEPVFAGRSAAAEAFGVEDDEALASPPPPRIAK